MGKVRPSQNVAEAQRRTDSRSPVMVSVSQEVVGRRSSGAYQGLKDVCVDVILERLNRDAFNDVTRQRGAVVGVRGCFAGREDTRGQMRNEIFLERKELAWRQGII